MVKVEKINQYKSCYEKLDKELNKITGEMSILSSASHNSISSKEGYKKVKLSLLKYNKLLLKSNKLFGKRTKYRFLYVQSQLLNKYKTNKPNDAVYHDFIEYIEANNEQNDLPYKPYRVWILNRYSKRLNKKMLRLAYLTNVSSTQKSNKAKAKFIKSEINILKRDIQTLDGAIKDIKQTFFSKYHAKQVKKLENVPKDHGVKTFKSNYVIDLVNVVKYYNNGVLATKVLKNINLKIKSGEFVVILGPSGSGKTTLLNIISGMDNATYGRTIICNNNLINFSTSELTNFRRDNIGYVFQQYGLLPNLTIRENVEIGSNLQTNKNKKIDIDELLKTIGIYDHRNKFPNELSGGQQQRVSIARSIAKNPNIIFGDEPTGAIDEKMSKQVMQLFLDINKKYKTTIVIVTHNPIFASLATTVIKVSDGNISEIIKNSKPKSVEQLKWSR